MGILHLFHSGPGVPKPALYHIMAHRIITQVIFTGTRVVGRAFAEAYKQASASSQYAKGQANMEDVMERFKKLFDVNDPQKGGSFYLQSKVLRARERIEAEVRMKEELAGREAELKEGWKPKVFKDR